MEKASSQTAITLILNITHRQRISSKRAKGIAHLHSWQQQHSEIEFLYTTDNHIIPIEVKSGNVTRSKSLNKYAEKYHPPYRALFSANSLHIDVKNNYHRYPLYMAYWFPLIFSDKTNGPA